MDTKPSPAFNLTTEKFLYILAFSLGLSLRLFRLGAAPLSEYEAGWAMQALELARGNPTTLGAQPAFLVLTSLFFTLFKDTNATARLWSAISGSLLPLFPLFFLAIFASSFRLRRAGLILAFGLALDPALVVLSRTAGGPISAVAFSLLALGAALAQKPRLAGILGGLAILSGPSLLQGILGFILGWLAFLTLVRSGLVRPLHFPLLENSAFSTQGWKQALIFGAGTLIAVGTLLLRLPQGLGAALNSLPAYLESWSEVSEIPAWRLPWALFFYQPLAFLAGLVGAISGWRRSSSQEPADQLMRFLSLWALLALFAGMILPGRQVYDAVWSLIPLWGLAALALSADAILPKSQEQARISLAHSGLNVLLMILIWHNLLRMQAIGAGRAMMIAVTGGILFMALIAAVLVATGWSIKTAALGISWGVSALLAGILFFRMWSASQVSFNQAVELWTIGPAPGQMELLTKTLRDLSGWKTGQSYELDIFFTVDSPSVRWTLRSFPKARYVNAIPPTELPSVIITRQNESPPALSSGYRGQDLILHERPAWEGTLPTNLLNWLTYRQAPVLPEKMIVWVRNDLFPGGSLESLPSSFETEAPENEFTP